MLRPILSLLLAIGLLASCQSDQSESAGPLDLLPADAKYLYRFNDIAEFMADLRNNPASSNSGSASPLGHLLANAWVLDDLPITETSYLALVPLEEQGWSYLLVNDLRSSKIDLDSVLGAGTVIEGMTNGKYWKQEQGEVYSLVRDSLMVITDRENLLPSKTIVPSDGTRLKLLQMDTGSEVSQVMQFPQVFNLDSTDVGRTSWAGMELRLLPEGVQANGVVLPQDSTNLFLSLFKGLNPQPVQSTALTPAGSESLTGLTFDDTATFFNNRQYEVNDSLSATYHPAYETVDEVAHLKHQKGEALILHSLDIDQALLEIDLSEDAASEFRSVRLFEQAVPDELQSALFPLLPRVEVSQVFSLDEFIVLASNREMAEAIIACAVSGNCLQQTAGFQDANIYLSTSASYYLYLFNQPFSDPISNWLGVDSQDLPGYRFGALQLSTDQGFSHVNLVAREQGTTQVSERGISERFNLEFENDLLTSPQFFTNHRTRGQDIVVQDVTNTLHFISASGKTLWTKSLDYPILGQIHEVDLLRNGKKQLAFSTTKAVHVIDRNGNPVAPFPKKFKDDITQPMALFDYDNNRNYRFVVIQGEEIWMLDRQAKTVQGFTFRKADSEVVLKPEHIRMNNKDYLLFAQADGKLNILNRRGKPRVTPKSTFEFSDNPLEQEGDNFVVITADKKKISIDESGSIAAVPLDVTDSYWFTVEGNTKATLDDNLLRINGQLVELPYDLYESPKIFTVNRKVYISVTGQQENKVYLFDRSGKAIPGFPVFGSSAVDLGDSDRNGKPELLVRGGPRELVLYQID
jgi:hypothetical protein